MKKDIWYSEIFDLLVGNASAYSIRLIIRRRIANILNGQKDETKKQVEKEQIEELCSRAENILSDRI